MKDNILLTGGAGFIGINTAEYYLNQGKKVTIFDNFHRGGAEKNAKWLKEKFPLLRIVKGDIRKDRALLLDCVNDADVVFHMAAQVAVTTSVENPQLDFETNALGTFNVLESVRLADSDPAVMYSSTNKVYGNMEDLNVIEKDGRYGYETQESGIDESRPIDFHSPYGCSKGCGDQYVRDYSRIYGLKGVVFRKSCIYGPRQFGIEDQGWVAWFTIASAFNKKLTIFGDGKQIRDVLYVTDLIQAYDKAIDNIEKTRGRIFNIGGGPNNTLSLLELTKQLEKLMGKEIPLNFSSWRPGDQKVFMCDINKAKETFGWEPKISPEEGVVKLFSWVKENKDILKDHV